MQTRQRSSSTPAIDTPPPKQPSGVHMRAGQARPRPSRPTTDRPTAVGAAPPSRDEPPPPPIDASPAAPPHPADRQYARDSFLVLPTSGRERRACGETLEPAVAATASNGADSADEQEPCALPPVEVSTVTHPDGYEPGYAAEPSWPAADEPVEDTAPPLGEAAPRAAAAATTFPAAAEQALAPEGPRVPRAPRAPREPPGEPREPPDEPREPGTPAPPSQPHLGAAEPPGPGARPARRPPP
mmetsp:Transcript_26843/g.86685  ORF Transcript_26843/g.86685 Transcript_26843/m.86685 type:complete len:242 (-) Transcript_26843:995-1720(-)